ncbi:glycoside hydrolase family 16 protein [Atractiella rhizophila]|nr:glycoside hydrolase family 16 protein [Atractiella rhizophila]
MKHSFTLASLSSTVLAGMLTVPKSFNLTEFHHRLGNKEYSLIFEAKGDSFFDQWEADVEDDPTHGQVNYVDLDMASSLGLTSVNSHGNVIMKVDSTSDLASGEKRNSVRIHSTPTFTQPSLIVIDAVHVPFGCAVWPAFWSFGPDWPNNGEIDIIEGVHNQEYNQATLHTSAGCNQSGSGFTGTVLQTECDVTVNSNAGCGIKDDTPNSYGESASKIGGGVWTALFDDSGVYYWHFPRGAIPADLSDDCTDPKPSLWGPPVGRWDSATCSPSYFGPQNLIFDITLCGDWAGNTFTSAGCGASCSDHVMTGSNFANAYWEVGFVRVFN